MQMDRGLSAREVIERVDGATPRWARNIYRAYRERGVSGLCDGRSMNGRGESVMSEEVRRLLSGYGWTTAPGGVYVLIGHDHFSAARGRVLGTLPQALGQMALSPFVAHLPRPDLSNPRKPEAMVFLRTALAAGRLTPTIDRVYPLEDAVAALRRLMSGGAVGRIVVVP